MTPGDPDARDDGAHPGGQGAQRADGMTTRTRRRRPRRNAAAAARSSAPTPPPPPTPAERAPGESGPELTGETRRTTRPRRRAPRSEPLPGDIGDDPAARMAWRDLAGAGSSRVGVSAAARARDMDRPTPEDLAAAEAQLVIVRRPAEPGAQRAGRSKPRRG